MTRTFVAIELGDQARAHLDREIARLRRVLPSVRWGVPDSMHLTLAFLGELDDERLAAVEEATEDAAHAIRPFSLRVTGLGAFGPTYAPRVIWAGLAGDLPRLSQLQQALAAALAVRGFARDERPFSPHLTLARVRERLPIAEVGRLRSLIDDSPHLRDPAPDATIPVDHISVMKSELSRPAARYTCLRAVPLGMIRDTPPPAAPGSS
ncbi:MAG TPA: RNA 2',3'-cyclic phosphodiesterase [Ktedonobacterales bacterium]